MSVPFGKLNGKLRHAGRPHGDDPLPFAVRHLCRLVESALELLFEIGDERWRFALGAFWVAALPRLELVLLRGPTLYSLSAGGSEGKVLLRMSELLSESWC